MLTNTLNLNIELQNRLRMIAAFSMAMAMVFWPLQIDFFVGGFRVFYFFLALFFVLSLLHTLIYRAHTPIFWMQIIVIAGFVFYNLVSYLCFSMPVYLGRDPNLVGLLGAFLSVLCWLSLNLNKQDYERIIICWVMVSAFFLALLIFWHMVFFKSHFLTAFFDREGFLREGFTNKNQLALGTVLLFPFSLSLFCHERTILRGMVFVVIAFANFYIFSRMTFLAMGMSLILVLIFSLKRVHFLPLVIIVIVVGLILKLGFQIGPGAFLEMKYNAVKESAPHYQLPQNQPAKWVNLSGVRGQSIQLAWQGFLQKPFFGFGFGSFPKLHPQYDENGRFLRWMVTHNDFLNILFELGLFGIGGFLMVLSVPIILLWRIRSKTPKVLFWLWDAQWVSWLVMVLCLLVINAYDAFPFWFLLGGALVFVNAIGDSKNAQ